MLQSGCYRLVGSVDELSRACFCTPDEFRFAADSLSTSGHADVHWHENGHVTLVSRRLAREANMRERARLRKQKLRERSCHTIVPENGGGPSQLAPLLSSVAVIQIPTNQKGIEVGISQEQVEEFIELFPAVDVLQELRNMRAWSIANPNKRKTASGMNRFVTRWLTRKQDDQRPALAAVPAPPAGVRGMGGRPLRSTDEIIAEYEAERAAKRQKA